MAPPQPGSRALQPVIEAGDLLVDRYRLVRSVPSGSEESTAGEADPRRGTILGHRCQPTTAAVSRLSGSARAFTPFASARTSSDDSSS